MNLISPMMADLKGSLVFATLAIFGEKNSHYLKMNVMISIFGDFWRFSGEKIAISSSG
jgi:hypothetical protein